MNTYAEIHAIRERLDALEALHGADTAPKPAEAALEASGARLSDLEIALNKIADDLDAHNARLDEIGLRMEELRAAKPLAPAPRPRRTRKKETS